jgi:hypothetical protein
LAGAPAVDREVARGGVGGVDDGSDGEGHFFNREGR